MKELEELEELARYGSPRERFLCLLHPSLEPWLPFPQFLLLPAPLRRVVPLPLTPPVPRRDPS